jgi:membrane protease YdiL (CAAX protease family)
MLKLISRIFVTRHNRLHDAWWIATFFALLAALLFPALLLSIQFGHEISMWEQVLLIALVTLVVQVLRRKPLQDVTGHADLHALKLLGVGLGLGFLLMAAPAALLWVCGWVVFSPSNARANDLVKAVSLMAGVAFAEELLFRGVIFQRLIAAIGIWPAQIAIGLLFVLTHMSNPGMDDATKLLAGTNIFLASLLFGEAFVRSRSLALPIGLHFMANVTEGILFGFGVSGNEEPSVLLPNILTDSAWLTGGAFGLEASLPGLIAVAALLAWLLLEAHREKDEKNQRNAL